MDLDNGLYHCFVCDASGDRVKFVMEKDGLDFMEAARQLGALVPVNDAQARKFRREREAKVKAQHIKQESWVRQLEGLLSDMELYESVLNWAFRHRDDRLHELAQEGITLTGQRYILAKLEAEHGAR
jgi:DNA primase